jgi:hypothetical protein
VVTNATRPSTTRALPGRAAATASRPLLDRDDLGGQMVLILDDVINTGSNNRRALRRRVGRRGSACLQLAFAANQSPCQVGAHAVMSRRAPPGARTWMIRRFRAGRVSGGRCPRGAGSARTGPAGIASSPWAALEATAVGLGTGTSVASDSDRTATVPGSRDGGTYASVAVRDEGGPAAGAGDGLGRTRGVAAVDRQLSPSAITSSSSLTRASSTARSEAHRSTSACDRVRSSGCAACWRRGRASPPWRGAPRATLDTNVRSRQVCSGSSRPVDRAFRRVKVALPSRNPAEAGFVTSAGGGTRTPDTRIMIPLL